MLTLHFDGPGLVQAVLNDDKNRLNSILTPVLPWKNDVLSGIDFILSDWDLSQKFLGLQSLASLLRNQGDLVSSASIASAMIDYFLDEIDRGHDLWFGADHMIANILDLVSSSMTDIGQSHLVIQNVDRWINLVYLLERRDYFEPKLRLKQVEAFMNWGRYEKAKDLLLRIQDLNFTPDLKFEFSRLFHKLPSLLRDVGERLKDWGDFKQDLLESVASTVSDENIKSVVHGLSQRGDFTPQSLANHEMPAFLATDFGFFISNHVNDLEVMANKLDHAGNPLDALWGVINGCGKFIQDDDTPAELYEKISDIIRLAIDYALKSEYWEPMINAKWILYVLNKRLTKFNKSIDVLRGIRSDINERRKNISDPRLRAGLMVYLPHLYESSAEMLFSYQKSNHEELFEVIEEGKSSILGELIEIKSSTLNHTNQFDSERKLTIKELTNFLSVQSPRSFYLTCLTGIDGIFTLLIDRNGNIYNEKINISQTTLENVSQTLKETHDGNYTKKIGDIDPTNPHEKNYNAIHSDLESFTEFFQIYIQNGLLKKDDHLYYSPEGLLYNFPLQMLKINDKYLIDYFSISYTPSARVLINCKNISQLFKINNAISIMVPKDNDKDWLPTFYRDSNVLKNRFPSMKTIENADATFSEIKKEIKEGFIIHFGIHGIFKKNQPLNNSGLYLTNEQSNNGSNSLLNVEKLSQLKLFGSHVTIRACVSGNVTQITSREALGIIWALYQSGISSAIVASWNVDIFSASQLLTLYYEKWLKEKKSKSEALRSAILELKRMNNTFDHPYHWAPFVLYGY